MTTFVDRVTVFASAGKVEMVAYPSSAKNLNHWVAQMAAMVVVVEMSFWLLIHL